MPSGALHRAAVSVEEPGQFFVPAPDRVRLGQKTGKQQWIENDLKGGGN
jgi:hypothetical protein